MPLPAPLTVKLGPRSYQIRWQSSFSRLAGEAKSLSRDYGGRHAVITNQTIKKLYANELKRCFPFADILAIPAGEQHKNMATVEKLANRLLNAGFDRQSCLWAVGGGVVGDITGWLASMYMRGVPFVQVPTTLLAMVDSSVGGKTGVNLAGGKNMVGAFYQPDAVLMCLPFLETLPGREFQCGLAEIVKSALIRDPKMIGQLEENAAGIAKRQPSIVAELTRQSAAIKSWVVERDERESGLRAILNFGHTLAHAIESWYDYRRINHGEAVAIGMGFASYLSYRKGYLKEAQYRRAYDLLDRLNLPLNLGSLPSGRKPGNAALVKLMAKDKKNRQGKIHFVFLDSLGKYRLPEPVPQAFLSRELAAFAKL